VLLLKPILPNLFLPQKILSEESESLYSRFAKPNRKYFLFKVQGTCHLLYNKKDVLRLSILYPSFILEGKYVHKYTLAHIYKRTLTIEAIVKFETSLTNILSFFCKS
jgi:hypothetical protein